MKTIILFCLVMISLVPAICLGQEGLNIAGFVPNVIPPSPNAYELGKYGQIPVGLYTGSVNYELPLYTYKTTHLNVPISLQYSSNGIRVDQVESNVGMGWNLNVGGVVTKISRNRPDDGNMCLYPDEELNNVQDPEAIAFFNSVGNWNGDAEPDLFMFNFPGHSGKFVYDKDNNIILIPLQDLKIEENVYNGFCITCSDGVKYYFEESEEVMSRMSFITPPPPPTTTINSWYLTRIVHPFGDTVEFEYALDGYYYYTSVCETYTVLDPPGQNACGSFELNDPGKNGPFKNKSTVAGKRLTKIYSSNSEYGEVDFLSNHASPDVPGFNLITNITVIDPDSIEIERFDFNYTTYHPGLRVFLNEVMFKDVSKYYRMEYIHPDSLPIRLSYAQDHWGYYNGAVNNINFYPEISDNLFFSDINGANKEPNGIYSRIGLLQKITYPTKGYSEIFYEPNDYFGWKHVPGHYATVELEVETNDEGWGSAFADSTVIVSVAEQQIRIIVDVEEIYNPNGEQCFIEPEGKAKSTITIVDNSNGSSIPLLVKTNIGFLPRGYNTFSPNGVDNTCFAQLDDNKSYTITLTPKWKCMTSQASIKYFDIAPYEYYANIETGGQRVKKTINFDPFLSKSVITNYFYYKDSAPEESSGVPGQKGLYMNHTVAQIQCSDYIQAPLFFQVLSASSLCPLFNTNNNNIYYSSFGVQKSRK